PRAARRVGRVTASAGRHSSKQLGEREQHTTEREASHEAADGCREEAVAARGRDPVLGLEERVVRMPRVRRGDLREVRVRGHEPPRDAGDTEAEQDDDAREHAERPHHRARTAAATADDRRRRKTPTRARRRGSYPTHFAAGTSSAPTRSNPSRTKNSFARSSTAHAKT